MSEVQRKASFDELHGQMFVASSQDVEPYLQANAIDRASCPEHGKYRGNLTKVASIPLVVVEMMHNGQCCPDGVKYNIMASDPDERRRALMHVQSCHRDLLTVNGKPFAFKRAKWE